VRIGEDCLIGPQAALAGCTLGAAVYVATQVMVFHGAVVGDGCRLGAGAIVHTGAWLPDQTRVGMRQFAVPGPDGTAVVTGDLDEARELLAATDFFGNVFADDASADLMELHRRSTAAVAAEIRQRAR
jgi:carbonic anhydrase/acetyltransferase-like protein (isoleucine patch superfamily)